MFAGTVIDDQVSDKFHTELMCLFDQGKAVLVRTVGWPDLFVVGNIVTHIILWRVVKWRDPNGIGAKLLDVLQLGGDTLHITPTIVVGVFETCGINLIDCGLFPPLGFCFWMCRRNSHCTLLSFLYEKNFHFCLCVWIGEWNIYSTTANSSSEEVFLTYICLLRAYGRLTNDRK
ncbi:Fsp2p [Saccharomyces cerevisiae AWRI796]|nr:Fsp2p [Saccharomyces cerevisiae AWRI796]